MNNFDTLIGALLALFGGFFFTCMDDKRRNHKRNQTISKALLIEINSLNEKMRLIAVGLNIWIKTDERNIPHLFYGLRHGLISTSHSGFSFIRSKNAFEILTADIINLPDANIVAKLFKYYEHVEEANSNINYLLYMKKIDFFSPEADESILTDDEWKQSDHYYGGFNFHYGQAVEILNESQIIEYLNNIINKKWYSLDISLKKLTLYEKN